MNFCFFRQLLIVAPLVVLTFASGLFLPKSPPIQESRLSRQLPDVFGAWEGVNEAVGKRERDILAADTDFSRKRYTHRTDKTLAPISVSVVFSGREINNSLHRPEVCLRTQGWNFLAEETLILRGALATEEDLPLRKIVMEQPLLNEAREPVVNEAGDTIYIQRVQYYTFLGADTLTASHWELRITDMRDRLRYGYDQKWAYTTFSTEVLSRRLAGTEYESVVRDLAGTEEVLQEFIRLVGPEMVAARKHPIEKE